LQVFTMVGFPVLQLNAVKKQFVAARKVPFLTLVISASEHSAPSWLARIFHAAALYGRICVDFGAGQG